MHRRPLGAWLFSRLICFDKSHAQLRDPRVRKAILHAIDRESIVKNIVEQHGASIGIDDSPLGGARVRLLLREAAVAMYAGAGALVRRGFLVALA